MMLSKSNEVLAGILLALAVLGALVVVANLRGWRRNGYFTIIATAMIVGAIFLLFQTLGGVLAVLTGGVKLQSSNLTLLVENGIAQLSVMLIGTVMHSRAIGQNPFAVFRLEGFHETPASAYLLAFPIIILAQIVGSAVATIWTRCLKVFPDLYSQLDRYESSTDLQMQGLVTAHGLLEFILIFVCVALIPAFAEETLFRGFAQTNIERSGNGRSRPIVALVVTSVLFAAIHLSVFKFPGLLALGLALGWMAYRTNNLFVGSLGHATNNGLIVMALYLNPDKGSTASNLVSVDQLSISDSLIALGGSLPFLALFLFLFHRVTKDIDARHYAEREIMELHTVHDEPSDDHFHDQHFTI